MHRRQLLAAAAAVPLMLSGARLAGASDGKVPYSRKAYESALASGEPFILDFYASW